MPRARRLSIDGGTFWDDAHIFYFDPDPAATADEPVTEPLVDPITLPDGTVIDAVTVSATGVVTLVSAGVATDDVFRFDSGDVAGSIFIGRGADGAVRIAFVPFVADFVNTPASFDLVLSSSGFVVGASATAISVGPTMIRGGGVIGGTYAFSDLFYATVAGSGADDTLFATSYGSRLLGMAGDDTLIGGAGSDALDGGPGADRAIYDRFYRADSVRLAGGGGTVFSAAGGRDTLTSIETIVFKDGLVTVDPDSDAAKVMRLYDTVLSRAPDPEGLDAWLDAMAGGLPFAAVAAAFVGSAEFQAATGALSDAAFVDYLYAHALGRDADPAGRSAWLSAIANGRSRTDVAIFFSESDEHRRITADRLGVGLFVADEVYQQVAALYDGFADRLPDAGGLDDWAGLVKSGTLDLGGVADAFAASAEFAARTDGFDDAAFVDFMYANALDRAPDAGGRAFWVAQLSNGLSRGDVLLDFSESPEHRHLIAATIQNGIMLG